MGREESAPRECESMCHSMGAQLDTGTHFGSKDSASHPLGSAVVGRAPGEDLGPMEALGT